MWKTNQNFQYSSISFTHPINLKMLKDAIFRIVYNVHSLLDFTTNIPWNFFLILTEALFKSQVFEDSCGNFTIV